MTLLLSRQSLSACKDGGYPKRFFTVRFAGLTYSDRLADQIFLKRLSQSETEKY